MPSYPVVPDIPGAASTGDMPLLSAAVATGAGSTLSVRGLATAIMTITGTFVATVTFQGTEDGINWSSVKATQLGTDAEGNTATAAGTYELSCAGLALVRPNVTAYTSGSITVTGQATGAAAPERVSDSRIVDPVTQNAAQVAQFHNADHQNPGTTAYGILTGGVAQLLTADGFIDRQKETGVDQVSNLGVVMGSQMFAQFFKTSVPTTGTITAGQATATITPSSMTGIQVGAVLTVISGSNSETVVVTALPSASTATVVPTNGAPSAPTFKNTYTPSYNVTGFLFNQERDASGEKSGASGKGTAVAAEYEYVSGGPPLANGTPSLLQYDAEVAALGKGAVNAGAGFAITSTTAGNTSLTLTTPANGATLTPGQWIQLSGSGTVEYVRVDDSYVISTAPATIPLTSPVVNTGQTTATWDAFSATGPGTNPILLTGEGLEGVILNDKSKPGFGRMWQGDPLGNGYVSNVGGTKATYTYAISATAPYAAPTDWIVVRGSATKTVKILRVEISGAATSATEVIATLNKHTVANTGGTSTTPALMQHDSADAAATALVLLYSVAPTIAGSATIWKTVRMTLAVAPAATTVAPDRYVYDYAAQPYEPLTLRGVAQECALNFAGVAVPAGGVYDVAITISEE